MFYIVHHVTVILSKCIKDRKIHHNETQKQYSQTRKEKQAETTAASVVLHAVKTLPLPSIPPESPEPNTKTQSGDENPNKPSNPSGRNQHQCNLQLFMIKLIMTH